MKVLQDTHIILWALTNDVKLPQEAGEVLWGETPCCRTTWRSALSSYDGGTGISYNRISKGNLM